MPDFEFETLAHNAGFGRVAGVDEAGRGPWAGPVVAAAVILDVGALPDELRTGLDDSKKLSAKRRTHLLEVLPSCAAIGIGWADVDEIDTLNILQASLLAMARALDDLTSPADYALIDGNRMPEIPIRGETLIKGDGRSLSIAAASIVAKVTRDRHMAELGATYQGYGWERNAGYGTAEHQAALDRLGVTPHHRKSFAPILKILSRLPI